MAYHVTSSLPSLTGHSPQRFSRWLSYSRLGGLCLLASVAGHLVLLGMPLPAPLEESEETEDPLMATDILTQVPVTVLSESDPQPELKPVNPLEGLATEAPVAVSPATPVSPPVVQPIAPSPTSTQPSLATEPLGSVTEAPVVDPIPSPLPSESDASVPFADFPHLEGSVSACPDTGNCWQSPVSSWRSATTDLRDRLEAQGYTLDNITGEVLSTETGARIYAVSKPGEETYYLNLVSVRAGILYSMTSEPITLEQVMALQGT